MLHAAAAALGVVGVVGRGEEDGRLGAVRDGALFSFLAIELFGGQGRGRVFPVVCGEKKGRREVRHVSK